MFPNLNAEMARRGVTVAKLSEMCGIRPSTLADKLNGKSKVTIDEGLAIKDALGLFMTLEELFATDIEGL